jgi:membrane protein YqaA with SNARE-associated domain
MIDQIQHGLMSLGPYLAAAVYCFFGGLIPMLNTELFVAFLGGMAAHDFSRLTLVALAAALGRMCGKTVLYFSSAKTANIGFKKNKRIMTKLQKWHDTIEKMPHSRVYLLTLIGSAIGVPPMYLLTIALGILRIPWRMNFVMGVIGSALKYAVFFGLGTEIMKWFGHK